MHRPLVHRSSARRRFRPLPPSFFTSPSLFILALLFPCNSALFDLLGPFDLPGPPGLLVPFVLLVPFGLLTVPCVCHSILFLISPFPPG